MNQAPAPPAPSAAVPSSNAKRPVSGIDTGILLEAGTNEAEILVFHLRGRRYGVNVAKVREVLPLDNVTEIPLSHSAVDGLIQVRELVVPLVNLERYLYGEDSTVDTLGTVHSFILLEFNNQHIAFRVQQVERIFRVSWKDTLPAPQLGDDAVPVTSILRQKEGLVPLLDFESISATIGVSSRASNVGNQAPLESVQRAQLPIVFADDSRMISEMVKDSLLHAGFRNLKGFSDGEDAWQYLSGLVAEGAKADTIGQRVALIITDVEMPRMDGLTFTRKIRQHPVLGAVPVVVFSSIASRDNEKKGLQVGATAQVAKPRYDDLINTVVELLGAPE